MLSWRRSNVETNYRLAQNAFGHWIVVNAVQPSLAWSGSRWVPVDKNGFPAGVVQVSNFATQESAAADARSHGLIPVLEAYAAARDGPSASFTVLAARNLTTVVAAILISWPVCGLRPMRALRCALTRRPIPGR